MTKRDSKGRFLKGGPPPNPTGRPKSDIKYQSILVSTISENDWKEIVLKAVEQAKNGDKEARKWLSDYLLGPATKFLEVTGNINSFLVDWSGWEDREDDNSLEGTS